MPAPAPDPKSSHGQRPGRMEARRPAAVEALESRIAPSTLVTLAGGSLRVQGDAGGAGQEESLFFAVAGGYLHIADPLHPITAAGDAVADGDHGVWVPLAALSGTVEILTGTGHDTLHFGGALPKVRSFTAVEQGGDSELTVDGSISAGDGLGRGGAIQLSAGRVEVAGSLSVSGQSAGTVAIQASHLAVLSGSVLATTAAHDKSGGVVTITGPGVELDGALIDASGAGGGGVILVGGDLHGAGALANAKTTFVDAATALRADATAAGPGGKIVVWGNQRTGFAGALSARGAGSGAGGAAEVSGEELLDFTGTANLTAPSGHTGTLLLDPRTIVIQSSGGNVSLSPATTQVVGFMDSPAASVIKASNLEAALLNATVRLQAIDDITFGASVTGGSGGNLILQAGRSVIFGDSAPINLALGGSLDVLAHDAAASSLGVSAGAPVISTFTGSTISSTGGVMSFMNPGGSIQLPTLSDAGFSVNINGSSVSLNGAVQAKLINVAGTLALAADVTTTNTQTYSSAVTLGASVTLAGSSAMFNSTLNTLANNLTITAASITFSDTASGSGHLVLQGPSAASAQPSIAISTYGNIAAGFADVTVGRADGTQSLSLGSQTFRNNLIVRSATGPITLSGLALGTNNLTVRSDSITLNGGANSITTTGQITLEPGSTGTTIGVSGGTGTLQLTSTNLAALKPGYSSLTIGRTDGTGVITAAKIALTGDTTFRGSTAPITFSSAVDSDSAARALTVSTGGAATFNGILGVTSALASLAVTSSSTTLNGAAVTTSGNQTFSSPLSLGGNTTLTSSNGGDLTFGTIRSAAVPASLVVSDGAAGHVRFNGAIGSGGPLFSLAVTGNAPTTLGGGPVLTNGGNQSYAGPLTLAAATTINTGNGNATFGKIDGAFTLGVTAGPGKITLNGEIGSVTPLQSFFFSSAITLNADLVKTTAGQTWGAALTLGATATVQNQSGSMTFAGVNAATDGGQGLTVLYAGTSTEVAFTAAIGNLHPLASLSVSAPLDVRVSGNISTTGDQTYSTRVLLAGNVTFTTKDSKISFDSTIDTAPIGLSLVLATGGGSLSFGGAIGSSRGLVNLTTTSGNSEVTLPAITLVGALRVTTNGGRVSQSGAANVIGGSITVGDADIVLSQTANDFRGPISLNNKGLHEVTITDLNALSIGASTLGAGTLTASAVGLAQVGAIVQTAGAAGAIFNGGGAAIDLSLAANDFTGPVSLMNSGSFPVTVRSGHNLALGHSSVGSGTLTATALGGELDVVGAVGFQGDVALSAAGTEAALILTAALTKSGGGAAKVQLSAAGDVILGFDGAVDAAAGGADLTLTADSDGSLSGAILLETYSSLRSNGGQIILGGGSSVAPAAAYGSGNVYEKIALASGVRILGEVNAGGGGIQITGHGGNCSFSGGLENFGVVLNDGAAVATRGNAGGITIDATAGSGSAALAIGMAHVGDDGTGTFAGDITISTQESDAATDSVSLAGAIIKSNGKITIQPKSADTTIGLGGAVGTLNLSTAELSSLADGFSVIAIGRADGRHTITANAATFTDAVSLQAGGGGAIILDGIVDAGANDVLLDAGSGTVTLHEPAVFTVKSSGVIADASSVNVDGGTLDLGAHDETVAAVTLTKGTIDAAGGTLTAGAFELQSGAVHASLAGATASTEAVKTGPGSVSLSAASTYAGGTRISAGAIEFSQPQALGTGTVKLNDAATADSDTALLATAIMNDENVDGGTQGQFNNDLVVEDFGSGKTTIGTTAVAGGATIFGGTLTLHRPVTLQGENLTTTAFGGEISGAAGTLTVTGGQRVTFAAEANTFTGEVQIAGAGTLLEVGGAGDSLPDTGNVDIAQGAILFMAKRGEHSETINALTGAGTVLNGFNELPLTLVLGGGNGSGVFSGAIDDGGGAITLFKTGTGTQTLSGTDAYTGSTIVHSGTLALVSSLSNNNIASSPVIEVAAGAALDVTGLDHAATLGTLVLANGQTLRGGGRIAGHVIAQTSTNVSPITDAGTAVLSTGGITFNSGSTLAIEVDGPLAGAQHGELSVIGTVALNDAALALTGSLASNPHQQIVLIQNDGADPIAGTFHGLAEGALVSLNGVPLVLSYHGGDGNDVTLAEGRSILVVAPAVATSARGPAEVVRVIDASNGSQIFSFQPYETKFRDSIRVAVADLNGDGFDDIVTTTGHGTGRLRVFSGLTGQQFTSGPFAQEIAVFNGRTEKGAFVAAGDLTGDGHADLIVGSALGGGKVRALDGVTGAALTFFSRNDYFQPFGKTFRGGLRVAAGDVNGDGFSDLVVGQSALGATVQVYDSLALFKSNPGTVPTPAPQPLLNFKFGVSAYRGGVNLATADLDGDGKADLIVGNNTGKPTQIQVFSGHAPVSARQPVALGAAIHPFDPNQAPPSYAGGVNVAALDVNGDGIADIIAANGGNAKSTVNIFSGADHSLLRTFTAFDTLPTAGVFIAASPTLPALR